MKSLIKENKPSIINLVASKILAVTFFYQARRFLDSCKLSPLVGISMTFILLILMILFSIFSIIILEWIKYKILKARGKL